MATSRCLLLGAILLPIALSAQTVAPAQPNVILVLTDDQGYGDVHCLGNTMIRTPTLDNLHSQSVRLTNFHVDPTCSPTRAALMTGHYSTRAGVWHTIMGRSLMHPDEVTMADIFNTAGYRTAIFGKWHLGDNYPMRPQDRGFQEVLVLRGGGIGHTPDFWGNNYFDNTFFHNGEPEKFTGYCTDVFVEQALKFIAQNKARPFFLYLPLNVPHPPFNVATNYSTPYRNRGVPESMANFYGMIENMDENLGRLLAKLKEWKLEENTIFIFMTDNGTAGGVAHDNTGTQSAGVSGWKGFNAGMHGEKEDEYDGGHRVPCFVRWPAGGISGGRDVKQLTAHFDLLPTLIELCGLKQPERVKFDGTNLAPLLRGTAQSWPDRTLFVHVQRREIPPKWTRSAVMTDRWRLVNGAELYDMQADPSQQNDIAVKQPDEVAKLRQSYESWWTGLTPEFSRYSYIVVGSPKENPTQINCHDWHSKQVPWNQDKVKAAPWVNGYWMIEVARGGKYEFTLRQQPSVANFPIQATEARLKIGDIEAITPVPQGAISVTMTLNLKPGPAKMETWFMDARTSKSRGAFFVDARWLP